MYLYQKFLVALLLSLCAAEAAYGQGAHYTYPFSVQCPEALVPPREQVKFTVKFPKTEDQKVPATWSWSVSAGTIVSGQGTPEIAVDPGASGIPVTATVERSLGDRDWVGTQKSDSCTAVIQNEPEPRLVDEFRTAGLNCEEAFARMDSYYNDLQNNPDSQGMIILYGDTKDPRATRRRELQLSNHITFRRFDRSRITFVRGGKKVEGTTQLWVIPPGASSPPVDPGVGPAEVDDPAPTKPYVYATEYMDGVAGCSGNIFDLGEYAKVIKSNAGNTGRIVIGQSSQARFQRASREIRRELAGFGVPRTKITTVYKYVRPNRAMEYTELWVIPPKAPTRMIPRSRE